MRAAWHGLQPKNQQNATSFSSIHSQTNAGGYSLTHVEMWVVPLIASSPCRELTAGGGCSLSSIIQLLMEAHQLCLSSCNHWYQR